MKTLRNLSSQSFLIYILIFLSIGTGIVYWNINTGYNVSAAYTESDNDTFATYKSKIESALQDLERDFRVNGSVTDDAIANIRSLVQEAYIRLPDTPGDAEKNSTMKKWVDLYLDLAAKNKSSQTHISNAISQTWKFISEVQIKQIEWSISANPNQGNVPLTSSFLANAKDPSWVNIDDSNYIWWMRENGGYRKELQRWPTLTHTFSKEWNYQIFLDVISGSRNSKWKTDVLPLSTSQNIVVLPRLGNIILLVNGVNVSNLDKIKINPTLGKIGIIFDATASRAVSNGTIQKTKWDFWNDNTLEYDGSPIIERQLFVNQKSYKVILEITTNQWQTFKKELQLIVQDPSAVISSEKDTGFIGEEFRMSAKSLLTSSNNVEYSWQVSDTTWWEKPLVSQEWATFSYKFTKVWQYIVSLTARSANGNIDKDSQVITIESHEPVINLDSPKPLSTEKPNTILFDASRSFDPDTNDSRNLSYTWYIDKEKVSLDNIAKDWAIGSYTFSEKWTHTVSLTIANTYGKVKTIDKSFDVTSTLTVAMNISPRAAAIGTSVGFQARAPRARFFEWNVGDGSPSINGTTDNIVHTYKKTWVYSATLTVKNGDGSESNTIERKVYVTDANTPFALIDIRNSSNTAIEDATACSGVGAFQINRAESTTIDGGNSINTDGNSSGLSYTWKYLDRVKTGSSFSEKFTELGCFPIELTVRSDKNGASHTSKRYIQIKNIIPKITSIDATIDPTKKDSQKIIVTVTANGARDEDGVITSYIWYYTTESDSEPQNVRITQSPKTTFVVPNVTEKYKFWVILEDNDGARVNSADIITDQSPLLIANDNANINMPLISLSTPKTQILTDEPIEFNVSAKNILGTDITSKSEYQWDFDGDGKIDKKTTEPKVSTSYKSSWKYTLKVKVTYNGTSNTKYQLITVKNELKASVQWYRHWDYVYLLNTSQWTYDRALWKIGERASESLYGISIPASSMMSGSSQLTVNAGDSETSSVEITPNIIQDITSGSGSEGISIQTYPTMSWDTITLKSRWDKLLLSAFGNDGTQYSIDTDTKIDSDLDGIGDNDPDNKNTPSYTDGSVYMIDSYADSKVRDHQTKITITKNGVVLWSRTINVLLDYIIDISKNTPSDISGTWSEWFSTTDKANLEKLQGKIRTLESGDRIILTQDYNSLIEWWGDLHDRTQGLLDIQKYVNESVTITESNKTELSSLIDTILVGDAQATNEITVASQVIEWLIKIGNPNRDYIIERLEKIKTHPGSLSENKILGKEILEKVQADTSMSNEDKLIIRSQMLVIVNGGQESVSAEDTTTIVSDISSGGGILGFIGSIVKIFFVILGVLFILFLIVYIIYRITRKWSDMGFQDFIIDSITHWKKDWNKSDKDTTVIIAPATERSIEINLNKDESTPKAIDPLENISGETILIKPVSELSYSQETLPTNETTDTTIENPIQQVELTDISSNTVENHTIPDWLKPVPKIAITDNSIIVPKIIVTDDSSWKNWSQDPLAEENTSVTSENIQAWENNEGEETGVSLSQENEAEKIIDPLPQETSIIPDWLRETKPEIEKKDISKDDDTTKDTSNDDPMQQISPASTELPDWLRDSAEIKSKEKTKKKVLVKKKSVKKIPKIAPDKTVYSDADIPDWIK